MVRHIALPITNKLSAHMLCTQGSGRTARAEFLLLSIACSKRASENVQLKFLEVGEDRVKWLEENAKNHYLDVRIDECDFCVIRWAFVHARKASDSKWRIRRALFTWHTERWQEALLRRNEKMANR
jgi:hypothetical protein